MKKTMKGDRKMESLKWCYDWVVRLGKFVLPLLIGGCLGCWAALRGAEKTNQLAREDRVYRLQQQLDYLIDLYKRMKQTFTNMEDIPSLIWESDIFIIETDYKIDLLYADLAAADKQKILSWFHQWECVSGKMKKLERERDGYKQLGITFIQNECPRHYQRLEALFPNIEEIIKKGIAVRKR